MKACVEQRVVERVEDDKEKKKSRRRSNRRSKQGNSVASASSSVHEIREERATSPEEGGGFNNCPSSCKGTLLPQDGLEGNPSNELELNPASNDTFISMQSHIGEIVDVREVHKMRNENILVCEDGGSSSFKSCPELVVSRGLSEASARKVFFNPQQMGTYDQSSFFVPHWSMEAVGEALEKGEIFRAEFRVNAYNRLEAYCKIDGVPLDVLINGVAMQNRAVEGDLVAIKVDPLPLWAKLKGSGRSSSGSGSIEGSFAETNEISGNSCKGKGQIDREFDSSCGKSCMMSEVIQVDHATHGNTHSRPIGQEGNSLCNEDHSFASSSLEMSSSNGVRGAEDATGKICALISSNPSRRPTGRVVSIIERSPRRDAIVGFLDVKSWLAYTKVSRKHVKKNSNLPFSLEDGYIQLIPKDARFPKMMVFVKDLPDCIQGRLNVYDVTIESELVAAQIDDWNEETGLPHARILHIFGHGGEMQPHIDAILFENAIHSFDFSEESLLCLPPVPWEVPVVELQTRKDLRNLCIFTIDPSTAIDLDDALSVEKLPTGIFRVGVHIADVSYFVRADTPLDEEARVRSTSVYMSRSKIPMLPPLLSEDLGSLNPGVDKLAFSILWDIDSSGSITDQWIGRTVIQSCCKLSYELAQGMIDCVNDAEKDEGLVNSLPQLYGHFEWSDVIRSVKNLYKISKILKASRFESGALQLESSKIKFLFDENGIPYDSVLSQRKESNFLVEEFMLLANRTAAEVISRAFPDTALLRRHPEPNIRKLKEFEAFCSKHGLELNTSSSGQFQKSLERIRESLKDDAVLLEILMSYASRPMQLANYFCTGDLKESEDDWGHYALAVPFYTHFTSPLRRYPDIVVHRMLAAALEAEDFYLKQQYLKTPEKEQAITRCFSGICFDKNAAASQDAREAFSAVAFKHGIPRRQLLTDVASYCNKRKLASRQVKDACDKLYMWVLLKEKKILLSEARVLGLGPKFMSIYIPKLAIERRIYYDEVEGLFVEWLEATSTLVLNLSPYKSSSRRGCPSKYRPLEEFSLFASPLEMDQGGSSETNPLVFPVTLHLLSTIPVALHAVGGHDGPLDVCARLYTVSYLR